MANHKDVVNAESHEPKHITDTLTTDAGKVLTPSDSVSGTSELRNLVAGEVVGLLTSFGCMEIINNSSSQSLTAATDSTLRTFADYTEITNLTGGPAPCMEGITFSSDRLIVDAEGIYELIGWVSFESSVSSTLCSLRPGVNGGSGGPNITIFKVANGNEPTIVSATGIFPLSAADEISMYMAVDSNTDIIIEDATFTIKRIR